MIRIGAVTLLVLGAVACTSPKAAPNPLVSRHKATAPMPSGGAAAIDGIYHNGGWNWKRHCRRNGRRRLYVRGVCPANGLDVLFAQLRQRKRTGELGCSS